MGLRYFAWRWRCEYIMNNHHTHKRQVGALLRNQHNGQLPFTLCKHPNARRNIFAWQKCGRQRAQENIIMCVTCGKRRVSDVTPCAQAAYLCYIAFCSTNPVFLGLRRKREKIETKTHINIFSILIYHRTCVLGAVLLCV